MFGALHRHARRGLLSGLLSVAVLAVVLLASSDLDLSTNRGGSARLAGAGALNGPCGPQTSSTIAGVDESVARRIYAAELRGYEVKADVGHIAGSGELLAALESSNQAAVFSAVHAIVYAPSWHIVRLRVVQRGHVLADVGGPDIIAPVSGLLRAGGRTLGSFVMSVQDDLGYTKLVSRFIGIPIDLYRGGSLVMGTLLPAPKTPSNGESLTLANVKYRTLVFNTKAFPTGTLKVALFVPAAVGGLSKQSCALVRSEAWGAVASHVAARFTSLVGHYEDFAHTLQGISDGLVFVRSGPARLVGTGPSRLPDTGTVKYRGRVWEVFSWKPATSTRIYFLTPASA